MAESGLLFLRTSVGDDNDQWDDTALIQAYEAAFKKVSEELDIEQPKKNNKRTRRWKRGDFCRCLFKEDGGTYEAKVVKLLENDKCLIRYLGYGNEEVVDLSQLRKSYGNKSRKRQIIESEATAMDCDNSSINPTEESMDGTCPASPSEGGSVKFFKPVPWENFALPLDEAGPSPKSGFANYMDPKLHSVHAETFTVPAPPPPLPPIFKPEANQPADCNEALNAMLLSWYMSGYHTGYYEGLKSCKKSP